MGFALSSSGSFDNTERYLRKISSDDIYRSLERHASVGVSALARATPRDTGATAAGWTYRIAKSKGLVEIQWYNTHRPYGEVVAILIQYGHGTGTGGYIQGIDYINPAMRPVFEQIVVDVLREVSG